MSHSRDAKYQFTGAQRAVINADLAGRLSPKLLADDADWIAQDAMEVSSDMFRLLDFEVSLIYPRADGRTAANAIGTAEPVISFDGHSWPMPPMLRALLVEGVPIEDFDALRDALKGIDFGDPARVATSLNDALAYSSGDVLMFAGYPFTKLTEQATTA
jgi:hypothetical protein